MQPVAQPAHASPAPDPPSGPVPSANPLSPAGPIAATAGGAVPFAAPELDPEVAARLTASGQAPDGRPLVAAVAQDAATGHVLMVAWMDAQALGLTLATGRATYYSRSRQALWVKGETSGHTQAVREVRLDCDGDTVLLRVEQVGAACHTGAATCFDRDLLAAFPSPAGG